MTDPEPESGGLDDLGADRALLERASTTDKVADVLRTRIAEGYFRPGARLPEDAIRGALGISRNTLRESFRLLGHEGLVRHSMNRGVFVRMLTLEDLEDLYRVRKVIEGTAVASVRTAGLDLRTLDEAVKAGAAARRRRSWQDLGTANIHFHQGIVALLGSDRLDELMRNLLAELRLVFHMMQDVRALHEPYLPRNIEILELLRRGEGEHAEDVLHAYLNDALAQFTELYSKRLEASEE